jgi:glyoxylase-like metal-dependent hydrolase (beta-lactamase superfamily II)
MATDIMNYKGEHITIYPLSEGSFTVGKDKKFIPFNNSADDLQDRSQGSILVEIQPFVVITPYDIILLDTGLGFSNTDSTLQIHQNLLNVGINPFDVSKVILSHLHKDHSGGISREDKVFNTKTFAFPQATYYVNKQEYDFAMATGAPSFTPAEFNILGSSDKVIFTESNSAIDDYIFLNHTGAHSPNHQSITIKLGAETIFFGGDVAPQLNQMRSKFVAKYDFDGKLCMELRQQWWQQGELERWVFLFYHDIKTPIFQF